MSLDQSDTTRKNKARRKLLRSLAAGGGVMATGALLPKEWTAPIVESAILPAHAGMSPPMNVTGNFGPAAMLSGARNDSPSVLDLVVSPAHASLSCCSATVGNLTFSACYSVFTNSYALCGSARGIQSSALTPLNCGGKNVNGELGDCQANVEGTMLFFRFQQVRGSPPHVRSVAQVGNSTVQLFAFPGCGCNAVEDASTIDPSSPYTEDEEIT